MMKNKHIKAKGKIVRNFGINIYGNPKFDRILAKRSTHSGMHGLKKTRRRKISEYGKQLLEKQKLKYTYGLRERQFRILFKRALKMKGITGELLIILLESRLDNILFRMGFAPTREAARQLTLHGHILINDRKHNISSRQMRSGDIITVKTANRSKALMQRYLEENANRPLPEWVQVDKTSLKGEILRLPMRSEIQSVANEQLVVELYSK